MNRSRPEPSSSPLARVWPASESTADEETRSGTLTRSELSLSPRPAYDSIGEPLHRLDWASEFIFDQLLAALNARSRQGHFSSMVDRDADTGDHFQYDVHSGEALDCRLWSCEYDRWRLEGSTPTSSDVEAVMSNADEKWLLRHVLNSLPPRLSSATNWEWSRLNEPDRVRIKANAQLEAFFCDIEYRSYAIYDVDFNGGFHLGFDGKQHSGEWVCCGNTDCKSHAKFISIALEKVLDGTQAAVDDFDPHDSNRDGHRIRNIRKRSFERPKSALPTQETLKKPRKLQSNSRAGHRSMRDEFQVCEIKGNRRQGPLLTSQQLSVQLLVNDAWNIFGGRRAGLSCRALFLIFCLKFSLVLHRINGSNCSLLSE